MAQSLDFYGSTYTGHKNSWLHVGIESHKINNPWKSVKGNGVASQRSYACPHPAVTLRFLQFNIALLSPHNPHIAFFLSRVTVKASY